MPDYWSLAINFLLTTLIGQIRHKDLFKAGTSYNFFLNKTPSCTSIFMQILAFMEIFFAQTSLIKWSVVDKFVYETKKKKPIWIYYLCTGLELREKKLFNWTNHRVRWISKFTALFSLLSKARSHIYITYFYCIKDVKLITSVHIKVYQRNTGKF